MSDKPNAHANEYTFSLDGPFSAETFPMGSLAEYLHDLAILYGHEEDVFFLRLQEGSAQAVAWATDEVMPAVDYQLRLVALGEASEKEMNAYKRIDNRARSQQATGSIFNPFGEVVVPFPGRDRVVPAEVVYGPFEHSATVEGVPISIGGKKDIVSIHIEDRFEQVQICKAKREIAKEISKYLFEQTIRVFGTAKMIRHADGRWERKDFNAQSYEVVNRSSISEDLESFKSVDVSWEGRENAIRDLSVIRHDDEVQ
jgi:hypothetical protein